jgi:hypothetical protein
MYAVNCVSDNARARSALLHTTSRNIQNMIVLLFLISLITESISSKSNNDDDLVGHIRQPHEPGLNANALAALTALFRDEWRNESLLPEYENDLNRIRCPKWRGRPHTIWCNHDGDVTRLTLHAATIHASLLPPAIFQLSKLAVFELVDPRGALRTPLDDLVRITSLQSLTFAHTDAIVGTLPTAIGTLTLLYELHFAECPNLSGTIPTEIGQLSKLQKVQLFRNQLSGTLPTQLGQLTELLHLYTFQNQLSGPVPTELANLDELIECRLQRSMRTPHADANTFTCPLPSNLPVQCKKPGGFLTLCHDAPKTEL